MQSPVTAWSETWRRASPSPGQIFQARLKKSLVAASRLPHEPLDGVKGFGCKIGLFPHGSSPVLRLVKVCRIFVANTADWAVFADSAD